MSHHSRAKPDLEWCRGELAWLVGTVQVYAMAVDAVLSRGARPKLPLIAFLEDQILKRLDQPSQMRPYDPRRD